MKSKIIKMIFIIAIPCVLAAAGYLLLMQYYKTNIPYGTWINDIYCTGLSYDEAARRLTEANEYEVSIDVTDMDGNVYTLTPDTSIYSLSYREKLMQTVSSFGAAGLFTQKHVSMTPQVYIRGEAWDSYISQQAPFISVSDPPEINRVSIKETDSGFELIDLCLNNLDKEKASLVIWEALEAGKEAVSLLEEGCYYDLPYSEADKEVLARYEALQIFCDQIKMDLTIQGKTVFTIDASVLKDWILKENGEYVSGKGGTYLLDTEKVREYAQSISKEVTTYWGEPWEFITHDGDVIEVLAGNYGRELQVTNLINKLLDAFQRADSTAYELEFKFYPEAAKEVEYGAGYGNFYIEVDLEGQHVYVYKDGELVLDSPCVTGDVHLKRETPKGVFYVEYKQRNRTLVGENYRTPVSYWMHFYNHCGFHDAGWRKGFGEDIYLTNGSHGCVNMPVDKAKELYNIVEQNMPVIVY